MAKIEKNLEGNVTQGARKPRIGLALGSGAARGWAHIGVIQALRQANIIPDIVCGSSIGALVGASYLCGSLEALRDWTMQLRRKGIVRLLDIRFSGGGLVGGSRVMGLLEKFIQDCSIPEIEKPFGAVATDLNTGNEVWLLEGRLLEAVRASISIPGLFTPVLYNGVWLIDGGVVNPIPVNLCRALGADIVIAVNPNGIRGGRLVSSESKLLRNGKSSGEDTFSLFPSSQEKEEDTPKGSGLRLLPQFFGDAEKGPGLLDVVAGGINIMQERIIRGRMAGDPPDALLTPRVGDIGLLEFSRAAEAIAAGEASVRVMLPVLEEILGRGA